MLGTKGNINYGTASVSSTTGFATSATTPSPSANDSSTTAPMAAVSTPSPAAVPGGESNLATTVGVPSSPGETSFTQQPQPTSSQEEVGEADEHILIGSGGPDQRESQAILKALDWLKEKRDHDYGWNNDTHMVILAKELSGGRDPVESDNHFQMIAELEDLLSVKQMEIEILTMLDRHHSLPKPVNADKLARYVLALGVLCKDPKRFHNHDLVSALLHHEPTQDQEFALVTLAACSSAAHVRKRHIRRLLDIASGGSEQSVGELEFSTCPNIPGITFFFCRHHGDGSVGSAMHHHRPSSSAPSALCATSCARLGQSAGTTWQFRIPAQYRVGDAGLVGPGTGSVRQMESIGCLEVDLGPTATGWRVDGGAVAGRTGARHRHWSDG